MRIFCCLAHGRKIAINRHNRNLIVNTFSLALGKTVTEKYLLSEIPDIALKAVFSLSPAGFTHLVKGSVVLLVLLSMGFVGSYIQEEYIDRVLIYLLPIPLLFLLYIVYCLFCFEKIIINDKNLERVITCAGLGLFGEKMPLSHIRIVRYVSDQAQEIYDEVLSIESPERIIKIRARLCYDEIEWLWRAVQNSALTCRNPRRAQS